MTKKTIVFFGDGHLTPNEPLILVKNDSVVCDYSECGMYIAEKHLKYYGGIPRFTRLNKFISSFIGKYDLSEIRVIAYNNGIATFFREHNIRTLKDLAEYFSKILKCSYP